MANSSATAGAFPDHAYDQDGYVDLTGTGSAYTARTARRILGNYRGLRICAKVNVTNAGACTLTVDYAPAAPIIGPGGGSAPAGALVAGGYYDFIYDEVAAGWQFAGGASARETLTANRTYYVRSDGSNSNSGLVDSAAGAFLTIQKAIDTIAGSIDLGGFTVTIQVRDGTYAGFSIFGPWVGAGTVVLVGNTTTPANCIIEQDVATDGNGTYVVNYGRIFINGGFRFRGTASNSRAIQVDTHGFVYILGSVEFATCSGDQIHISAHGLVRIDTNYSIVGGAIAHATVLNNGVYQCRGRTITLTGTPVFSTAFFDAQRGGVVRADGNTFSGSATGTRFNVQDAILSTGAADPDVYVPGNAAGTWELSPGSETVQNVNGILAHRVQSLGPNATAGFLAGRYSANANSGYMTFVKSRNATVGSHTVVQSGDQLGQVLFAGSDGTDFEAAAAIRGEVDGTPGANDMPGRIVFLTTPDGSATLAERMRSAQAGNVYFPSLPTTASAANAFLNSGSTPANELLRSTSSRRYKRDIIDIDPERAAAVLKLRPVRYRSTAPADRPDWSWYGLIAEEVAEVDPRLVQWASLEEGGEPVPDGVAYDRLAVLLLLVVRDQARRIEQLERLTAESAEGKPILARS